MHRVVRLSSKDRLVARTTSCFYHNRGSRVERVNMAGCLIISLVIVGGLAVKLSAVFCIAVGAKTQSQSAQSDRGIQ